MKVGAAGLVLPEAVYHRFEQSCHRTRSMRASLSPKKTGTKLNRPAHMSPEKVQGPMTRSSMPCQALRLTFEKQG